MTWTEDRVELLKKLWRDGQSASQIAKEVGGVTRNAVIGKVHRLGISNRAIGGESATVAKAAPKPELEQDQSEKTELKKASSPQPAPKPTAPPSQPPAFNQIISAEKRFPPQPSANEVSPEALASHREVEKKALRLSLMELTERTCKWPFGDPATDDFWFCGLPVEPGKSYCKPCAEVAYQPASARRARRR